MSTELATRNGPVEIVPFLTSRLSALAKCCPKSVSPETMIQVASLIISKTPELQKCTPDSIFTSIIAAGSLGFSLNLTQGEAYLIPRWNKNVKAYECSMQPGYRGLAKLVRGAGKVEYIIARLVHAKDTFSVQEEPETILTHRPHLGADKGPVTHVYSVVKFPSGSKIYEVMTFEEVEEIRNRSESPNGTFWRLNWGEMAKKTVIKRQAKGLDQTPELAKAIELDNVEFTPIEDQREAKRKTLENNSGHATGMYASPEQVAKWLGKLDRYVDKRNAVWLDKWQDKTTGEFPVGIRPIICHRMHVDAHLVKWAADTRYLDAECVDEQGRHRGTIGQLTAVLDHRGGKDRDAMFAELKRYVDAEERIWEEQLRNLHPELFEPQADDLGPELQADPDFEPGGADEDN